MIDQTLKNPNEAFQTGTDPALISATYSPQNTPVNVATIGTAPNISLPPPPTQTAYDISSLPTVSTLLNPAPTALDTQQTDLQGKLLADTKTLGTKTVAQSTAETAAGLPAFNAQLTDINGQLQTLQKENAAIPLQIQNDFAGRGATAAGVAPIQNEHLRNNSIKALGLSAIAQTLQGNVALAQQQANKAVELQFAPVQADIDYLTQALSINKDNLSREDQKRADVLQVQLQDRQRLLDQQKQDKGTILSWAAEAAKNGANTVVINQAMQASDPNQALQLLGQYLSDPTAKQQALANLALTRANINKTNADTNKTNVDATVAANPQNKPATQAQETVAGYASRLTQSNQIINDLSSKIANKNPLAYAAGGMLPSFLQGAERQQYDQATRNFVNAVLRQESGAAISPTEFDSAQKQYFPQPGDSAQVIAQKSANRDLVTRNFINASGNAYEAPPSTTNTQTYSVNGKTYVQGADGLYYPQ
jgi:hypothetical protein